MSRKVLIILVVFITLNLIECQLGQFGFPFFNNLQAQGQSSFNPQQQRPPPFTFGGDFFFQQDPFAGWTQPPRQPQQRPTTRTTTARAPPPPPTRAPTRPPTANVLPNRVGGRISVTSMCI